jgi:hypothetical protein
LLLTDAKLAVAQRVSNIPSTEGPPSASVSPKQLTYGAEQPQIKRPTSQTAVAKGDAKRKAEHYHKKDEKFVVDEQEARKTSEEDKQARELQKTQDNSKPVSSTAVPDTPW